MNENVKFFGAIAICFLLLIVGANAVSTPQDLKLAQQNGLMAKNENDFLKQYGIQNYTIKCDAKFCWNEITTNQKTVSRGLVQPELTATKTLKDYLITKVVRKGDKGDKSFSQIRTELFKNSKPKIEVLLKKVEVKGKDKFFTKINSVVAK